jgi:hypothetical protein
MRLESGLDLLLHAEAFAFNQRGLGVMQKAVEECRGERAVVVEYFGPVLIHAVRRNYDGASLIPLADDLEEQVGAMLVDGEIAEFINDEQSRLEILAQFALQVAMPPRAS